MKKQFKLSNLDCANCAAKMEAAAAKVQGVQDVKVNFISQKMMITADDGEFDRILEQIRTICRKVEPDCVIHAK